MSLHQNEVQAEFTKEMIEEAESIRARAEDAIGMCRRCKEWTDAWNSCCGDSLEFYDGPSMEDVDWAYNILEG